MPARHFDIRKPKHHAALPYAELPAFLKLVRAREGVPARALEFTILTAARTSEAIRATASEISRPEKVWTISAERMKAGKEHRVPLSVRAFEIVDKQDGYLFPGRSGAVGERAMLDLLEEMGRRDITVHGFRSTFRDWAAECTNFPSEVVEMALAHTIGNKVEAAYRRGDLFEKRRRLMDDWADYCMHGKVGADIVPIRA